jgi:DNA-binding NtrC family response regulator
VHDDAASLASLGEAMALEGYEVSQAGSGEEALRLDKGTEFDVVITDCVIREICGVFNSLTRTSDTRSKGLQP